MTAPVAVGVDNGGTWIRLKGIDKRGRGIWSLKKPSPTVDHLAAFLKKHLARFHGELSCLGVGSRGVWKIRKRREVARALKGLAKKIVVMSDVEAAWLAAFGDARAEARGPRAETRITAGKLGARRSALGPGIVVVAGTGSIAYGRRSDGTFARAGGLGPEKGDEGSGYWIGKEWLRKNRLLRFPSSPHGGRGFEGEGGAVRKTASKALLVIRKARTGNLLARQVTHDAQQHLSNLVIHVIRELRWRGIVPLAVSGSVLENKWFKDGFLKTLHIKGIKFYFFKKKTDQAIAPLTQVPQTSGGPPSPPWGERGHTLSPNV